MFTTCELTKPPPLSQIASPESDFAFSTMHLLCRGGWLDFADRDLGNHSLKVTLPATS